jgi:hypothetical protein
MTVQTEALIRVPNYSALKSEVGSGSKRVLVKIIQIRRQLRELPVGLFSTFFETRAA